MIPHQKSSAGKTPASVRRRMCRILKTAAVVLGCLMAGIAVVLVSATIYLTPANLTRILNREASEYFDADVRASNVRFTIWSTFPHFFLEMDSLRVVSRTLRDAGPDIRGRLPEDADFLVSAGKIKGAVNVVRLMGGSVWLKNVEIDDLDLNLVAFNDSVNNYDIMPSSGDKDFAVPYFTAESVSLVNPRPVRFFSAATQAYVVASLSGADLRRDRDSSDDYVVSLRGNVDADVRGVRILAGFPFSLGGRTNLKFHPFRVGFRDFAVDLGNAEGRLDMSADFGKSMSINKLTYRIKSFDLLRFLRFLPEEAMPYISGLQADLEVDASARLKAPYRFSATKLPSFDIEFHVPEGSVSYSVGRAQTYRIGHSPLSGRLRFDGEDVGRSAFVISPFTLSVPGVSVRLAVEVDSLLSSPSVRANVKAYAELGQAGKTGFLCPYALEGRFSADADVAFGVGYVRVPSVKDFSVRGKAALDRFSVSCGMRGPRLKGKGAKLSYEMSVPCFSASGLGCGFADMDANIDEVEMSSSGVAVSASDMEITADGALPFGQSRKAPLAVSVRAAEMSAVSESDSARVVVEGAELKSKMYAYANMRFADTLDVMLNSSVISFVSPAVSGNIEGIGVNASVCRGNDGFTERTYPSLAYVSADSTALKDIGHTAEYLTFRLPKTCRRLVKQWKAKADVKAVSGEVVPVAYSAPVRFSGFNLGLTGDSVSLRSLSLRSGSSAMRLSASAGNLRQAFTRSEPVLIPVRLSVDIDTLNINEMARAYGKACLTDADGNDAYVSSSADTVVVLLPRNLDMDLRVSAKETVYTNLKLYDLTTGVRMRDGVATVDDLRITSDFGHAYLDLKYDTRDAEAMSVEASLGFVQIDVVKFFENFHTLLLMMPQMKNLSGSVSAEAKGSMEVFPDMCVNVPSLTAEVAVQGRELKVHQNRFIRRITKMMLIPGSDDIHIRNMNVHASVHDNLLELEPFDFRFSNYGLRMQGLNNFNGDLYYHIGVERNPLHIPFGIIIEGEYSDPKLRFGRARYDERRAFGITGGIMSEKNINIVKEARRYLKEFISKAAASEPE